MSLFRQWQQRWRLYRATSAGKGTVTLGARVECQVPIRCDGRGRVEIGAGVAIGYRRSPRLGDGETLLQAREPASIIHIGARTRFSNNVAILATEAVTLGADCLIGDQVMIVDSDFHELDPTRRLHPGPSAPVHIGDNVWLGSRVMVLKGVTIGKNCAIAAGAVVTRDIPPDSVAAGIPARVVKTISPPPPIGR